MSLVETYYELPHTICIVYLTLGTDIVTEVNDMQVTLRFPRSEQTREWPMLVPPAFANVFDDDGFSQIVGKVQWGMETGTSGDAPESRAAWVSTIGLAVDAAPGGEHEAANNLLDAMDDLWPTVCDWIEVVTRQIHSTPGKSPILGPHHPVWFKEANEVKRLYRQGDIVVEMPPTSGPDAPVALTKDGLGAVLRHAKAGPPPTEWLLIRDARLAHHVGSRRIAVIDAGTAAELAITKMVRDEVAGVPDNVVELLLKGHRMLHASSQLLKKLGGTLRDNTMKLLIEPRNHAAHRGQVPWVKESHDALILAAEIVEAAYPLAVN